MGYLYNMDVIISESQLRFLIEGKRPKYTKDDIIKIAKNYDNYAEFQKKESGAYSAAIRFGPCYDKNNIEVNCVLTIKGKRFNNPEVKTKTMNFLEDITSNMEKYVYTKDGIRDIAKNYDNYTAFMKNTTVYDAARKFGPCYDKNGIEVKCYISKVRPGGMMKNPDSVRNSLEFFNEITSGMTRTDFGPKMVYSYTFFDDTNEVVGVYVGITNDEERRKKEHLKGESTFTYEEVKTAVSNFRKENPLFRVEYKALTEYIPFVDAQVKEEEYVNNAKSNGYSILNIAKTGGGGGKGFGFPDKYLIDKVNNWIKTKKDKSEEPLLKDFTNDYRNIYNNIQIRKRKGNQKLYDETLGKLIKSSKTDEELITIAMSCNSHAEFRKNYRKYYNQAKQKKILPQIKQMFADGLNTPDQTTPETTPSV